MIQRRRSESCLSDHAIDLFLAGEPQDLAHADGCSACSLRVEELRQERDGFEKQIWIAGEAKKIERRLRFRQVKSAALAVGSIAAVVLVALSLPQEEPSVRTKGGLSVEVIARHEQGTIENLLPGSKLFPGDAIRFRVTSESGGYLAISGLDAAQ